MEDSIQGLMVLIRDMVREVMDERASSAAESLLQEASSRSEC